MKSTPISVGVRLSALLLALVVTTLSTFMTGPAWAHASLVDSSPRQGDLLDTLPETVWFEFSDTVLKPAYVVVTAPDGTASVSGEPTVEGTVVRQALADGPDGSYTMAYRVVSEDGHPISGEITFSVGDAVGDDSSAATESAGDGTDQAASSTSSATSASGADAAGGDGPGLGLAVAVALFGGAAVLLLLSRRSPT